MRANKVLPQLAAIFIAAIVLIYIIRVPIGVADGGGQYKLLESLGLNYISRPSQDYFATQFGIYAKPQVRDTQTAIAAYVIGNKDKIFNVNSIAKIYALLFIIGLWLVVRSGMRHDIMNWAYAALCVLAFADVGYTAYFNTLYVEAAILTTLLLAASLILICHRKKDAPIYLVIPAVVFSLAFAFCGTLQAWVGIIFGILITRLSIISSKKLNKYASICGGLIVIIASVAFVSTYKPIDYEKNIFHSVFLGTAKYESVEKLGLNKNLDELKGSFYTDNLSEQYNLNQEFFSKINYVKITKFYITHPGGFIMQLSDSVKSAYTIRPSYLGNYTAESGKEKELADGFSVYSTLKGKFVPNTIAFTLIFFVIYIGMLVYIYISEKDKRPIVEVLIAFGISAAMCLKIPSILTGDFEIGRSMFTFNIMFDAMIITAIVAGGRYMLDRRKNLQNKYGSHQ